MARVFGLPMPIFVCLMGLIITAVATTGVIVINWLRKCRSSRYRRARRAQVATA